MNPISLASGVLPEFGPVDTVTAAAAAGFDAVGLWVECAEWTSGTTRDVRRRLADTGLPVLDVEVVWIKPGALDPNHLRIIDIGAEVGAANVLVVSSDPDRAATERKYAALCAHGHQAGLRVALEFGVFTDVRTIDSALDLIAAADSPAAALLVDPIHLDRSGGQPIDVAAVPRAWLPYAQICDAPPRTFSTDDFEAVIRDAVDERRQLGEGCLPVREVVRALPANLPLSVELRSRALREAWPDAEDRARAVADATRRYLRATAD